MQLAYPISLPITLLLLVVAAAGAVAWFKPRQSYALVYGALMLSGVFLALRFATWSAVLDDQGLRITAPVAFQFQAGEMAWADVRRLTLRHGSRRSPSVALRIHGADGTLVLPLSDMNPAEADRLLLEIRARTLPYGRDLAGEAFRKETRRDVGIEGWKPAMLRLKDRPA